MEMIVAISLTSLSIKFPRLRRNLALSMAKEILLLKVHAPKLATPVEEDQLNIILVVLRPQLELSGFRRLRLLNKFSFC